MFNAIVDLVDDPPVVLMLRVLLLVVLFAVLLIQMLGLGLLEDRSDLDKTLNLTK